MKPQSDLFSSLGVPGMGLARSAGISARFLEGQHVLGGIWNGRAGSGKAARGCVSLQVPREKRLQERLESPGADFVPLVLWEYHPLRPFD